MRLELCQRLSTLQLGQNTTLSVSAKPFVPLATSSQMGINGSGTDGSGVWGVIPNLPLPPFPTLPCQLSGTGVPRRPRYPLLRKMKEPPPMAPLLAAALSLLRRDRTKEAKEGKRKRRDPGAKLVKVAPKRAPWSLLSKIARRRLELQTKSTSQNSQAPLINWGK